MIPWNGDGFGFIACWNQQFIKQNFIWNICTIANFILFWECDATTYFILGRVYTCTVFHVLGKNIKTQIKKIETALMMTCSLRRVMMLHPFSKWDKVTDIDQRSQNLRHLDPGMGLNGFFPIIKTTVVRQVHMSLHLLQSEPEDKTCIKRHIAH